MIPNQIKFAIRSIRKDLGYNLINILGLTIGISTTLFLLIYVFDELSYDKYHEKSPNIYRVISNISEADDSFTWAISQIPLAPQIKQDYPEVIDAIRIQPVGMQGTGKQLFEYKGKNFYNADTYIADSNIFNVFTYPMISGDPKKALTEPNSIVLTESFAKEIFGDEKAIGKLINTTAHSLKVTGIIKDIPKNSHLCFSALVSRSSLDERQQIGSWKFFRVFTYLLMQEGTDITSFNKKIEEMYNKYMAETFNKPGVRIKYELQPLEEIHFHPMEEGEIKTAGDITILRVFIIIAVLLLLIAGINYMNLTTARSIKRSREVGIRKVSGAHRSMLVRQFLTESVILTILSLLISIGLCYVLLPQFNLLSGKALDFSFFGKQSVLLSVLSIIIILGVLSGLYPAFFLSGLKPVDAIKGGKTKGKNQNLLREVLVIIQFFISLAMIVSTIVIYNQLRFLHHKDMGFDYDNVIKLSLNTDEQVSKLPVLRNKLKNIPGIKGVCSTTTPLGEGSGKLLFPIETSEGMQKKGMNFARIDYDFIPTMNIKILDGRNLSREYKTDTLGILINEAMARRFGWENPLGKKIQLGTTNIGHVIGLINDYHQTGLYNPVQPLMLVLQDNCPIVYIKLKEGSNQQTITKIEEAWKIVFPSTSFEYTYLRDNLYQQIESDKNRGVLFTLFSIVAIIIAILGVLGLASYMVEQRSKEISIRKVLGISSKNVVLLIFKEYLTLIGIAALYAFPLAYYYLQKFLDDYEYHTSMSVFTFIFAFMILIAITLLTILYHTIKVAKANPLDSLRRE